jgi:hypothetical protein
MTKAMFGIATALALVMSSAWASDEKSEGKAAGGTVAKVAKADMESESKGVTDSGTGSAAEPSGDRAATNEAEAKAAHEERWLREREGYRDGGY